MVPRLIISACCGVASCIVSAAPATAMQADENQADENDEASRPCAGPNFRAFDFWVGTWDVFGPDGEKAGVNVVTLEENGCLLVERWTSVSGGTGQSYNYVDLSDGKWRQIWVSAGLTIDYKGGLDEGGAMALEGVAAYADGGTAPFRGLWTPNADGSVTQRFTQYDAATRSWEEWFVGDYRRRAESPPYGQR